jgi:hypothetical protein
MTYMLRLRRESVKAIEDPITGVDEELAISYMLTFLWIAAANKRLLFRIGSGNRIETGIHADTLG